MKLKPCPFCGKETTDIVDCSETTCAFAIDCFCAETCLNKMYAVVCNRTKGGCGATGGYYRTKEEAIEAWNRRANELDQR